MTILKFTVEVAYTLPFNFNIPTDRVELDPLNHELDINSDFRLKITKAHVRSDEDLKRMSVTFESEGFSPEPLEVIQGKVNDPEKKLLERFRGIGENLALLLQLKYDLSTLMLTDVKISPIQISDDKHINIAIDTSLPKTFVSVSLLGGKLPEPNKLRDSIKSAIDLIKLNEKPRGMLNLLRRIIKWYYRALDESDEIDKFIDYLMILEIWKLYKAHKNKDEKCIPTEKHGIPQKDCLRKAIESLCEDTFSKWNIDFDVFYKDGRNKVIHEGLQEAASQYLGIVSECASKIIEELRKEIQDFL